MAGLPDPETPEGAPLDAATLDAALAAALRAADAADAVLRSFAADRSRLTLRDKGTHELVSEADVAAQRALVSVLDGVVPGALFLGEEENLGEGFDDGGGSGDGALRWILDPLDGTTNFTRGVPPWAVSIALVAGRRPLVAVVRDVPHGETFAAVRGRGATLDGAVLDGTVGTNQPMRVSENGLGESLVATGFPYRATHYRDAYLAALGTFFGTCRGVRRHGAAAIDLAWTAAGRFDAFWETGLSPWDVAAGLLLVEEAGGRVTDFAGDADPVFTGQVAASNGRIHDAILAAVAPLRDVRG